MFADYDTDVEEMEAEPVVEELLSEANGIVEKHWLRLTPEAQRLREIIAQLDELEAKLPEGIAKGFTSQGNLTLKTAFGHMTT